MDTLKDTLVGSEATGGPPVGTEVGVELNPPSERDLKVYELVCVRMQSVAAVARRFALAPQTVRNIVRQTRHKLAREQFDLAGGTRLETIQLTYDRLKYQARLLTKAFLRSQRDVEFTHRSYTREQYVTGESLPTKEKEWTTLQRARPQARLMAEATRITERMRALADEFRKVQKREAVAAQMKAEFDEVWNDPESEPIVVKKQSKKAHKRKHAAEEARQAERDAKRAAAEQRTAERQAEQQRQAEQRQEQSLAEQRKILTRMLAAEPHLASDPTIIHMARVLEVPLPASDADTSVLSGVSSAAKSGPQQEMRAEAASAPLRADARTG